MFELFDERTNIWRNLKSGSLGTVLWALRRDRKVIFSFSEILSTSDNPDQFAGALEYPAFVSSNCIGQVALHQVAADDSARFHVEPRDPRWTLFRGLQPTLLQDLCDAIAEHKPFQDQTVKTLTAALGNIKSGHLQKLEALETDPDVQELQRQFLVLLGIGFGQALADEKKTLVSVLGDITKMNQSFDAPHYSFRKRHRISSPDRRDPWWSDGA